MLILTRHVYLINEVPTNELATKNVEVAVVAKQDLSIVDHRTLSEGTYSFLNSDIWHAQGSTDLQKRRLIDSRL